MSEESKTTPEPQNPPPGAWERRLGRVIAGTVFGIVAGGLVLALFMSLYHAVVAKPKVWQLSHSPGESHSVMKVSHLKACVKRLNALDQNLETETNKLWHRIRHGHRHYLTMWQAWGRDWQRKMKVLLKDCPMMPKGQTKMAPTLSVKTCVQRFRKLNQEFEKQGKNLWSSARKGSKQSLNRWEDWGQDWRRRMHTMLKQCPIYGSSEIARTFQRASRKMLLLQTKQEKAFKQFFHKNSDLFREIRQSLHYLQEELR